MPYLMKVRNQPLDEARRVCALHADVHAVVSRATYIAHVGYSWLTSTLVLRIKEEHDVVVS